MPEQIADQPAPATPKESGAPANDQKPLAPIAEPLLLQLENVSIATQPKFFVEKHPLGQKRILENVNLKIPRGAFVALVGESGSGKSLLTRAILNLLPASKWQVSGKITFNGQPLLVAGAGEYIARTLMDLRQNRAAAVFQEPTSYLNPALKIWRQMAERLAPKEKKYGSLAQGLAMRLHDVKLIQPPPEGGRVAGDYLLRFPHQFSQGQQQRLMLAMALGSFELVIADEPTASLDMTIQKEIVDLILKLREDGALSSLFLITHDLRLVKALLTRADDHVYFLDKEELKGAYTTVEHAPAEKVFGSSLPELAPVIQEQLKIAKSVLSAGSGDGAAAKSKQGNTPHLEIKTLVQSYKPGAFQKPKPVIFIGELQVNKGEILGIVGESGCGKSTLARAIARLLNDTDKRSRISYEDERGKSIDLVKIQAKGLSGDSRAMQRIRFEVQIIFQDAAASFNPEMTMGEMMEESMKMILRRRGWMLDELTDDLRRLCVDLNLARDKGEVASLLQHYPDELSAGQRQRFALARALLTRPKLLIADEPFTNVDRKTIHDMVKLIRGSRATFGTTFLIISHDLSLVLEICDRLVVMSVDEKTGIGGILDIGPPHKIEQSKNAYIQKLLNSILQV